MAQGILPFIFEAAPQPMDLTAHAGLTLVSETMLALGLDHFVGNRLWVRERSRGYGEFDKLHAIVLVQAAGGECVEDVRVLARHAGLLRLLERPLPSPAALHDFLAAFHDEAEMPRRPAEGAWVPAENEALRALATVNAELVQRAVGDTAARRGTLDLDATLIESHKRDALPHYKGGRGYQAAAVLWAAWTIRQNDLAHINEILTRIEEKIDAHIVWHAEERREGTESRDSMTPGLACGQSPCQPFLFAHLALEKPERACKPD